MTPLDLAQLEALLAASTLKLPLRAQEAQHEQQAQRTVDYVLDASDERIITTDGGYYGPEPGDIDLICALVNAAPQLLAIARAAQAWHAAVCDEHGGDCRFDPFNHAAPMCKLLNPSPRERRGE